MAKGTKTLNSAIQVDNKQNVYMMINDAEPADATFRDGEFAFYIDGTKFKVKARNGASFVKAELGTLA